MQAITLSLFKNPPKEITLIIKKKINAKSVVTFLFGGSLGLMIYMVSGYSPFSDWQWWAAFFPVSIIGFIYGEVQ